MAKQSKSESEQKHLQALNASNVLASMVGPSVEMTIDNDSIEALISSFLNNWTYDPITGTLHSLINSDISLIRNWELRKSLVAWLDFVEDLNEDEIIARNEIQERIIPFLVEQIPLRPVIRNDQIDTTFNSFLADYESLLRNRTFQNFVELRRQNAQIVLLELSLVRKECDKIILITQAEIDRH